MLYISAPPCEKQQSTKQNTNFGKITSPQALLTMTSLSFPFKPFAKLPHWQAQSRKHARQDRVTPAFYLNTCWIDWRSHLLWPGPQVVSIASASDVEMVRMTFLTTASESEMDPRMLNKPAPNITLQIVPKPAGLNNEFEVHVTIMYTSRLKMMRKISQHSDV